MRVRLLMSIVFGLVAAWGVAAHAADAADAAPAPPGPAPVSAEALIRGALELNRGRSSYAELRMRIHRPDWERTSELRAWTRGEQDAHIRFTAPARDAGNATLKLDEQMWTFTPKLNRTIRLPFSMMSQSWGGSDFSYHDLSRSDKLLVHYDHRLLGSEQVDGHTVYTIEATPHADAPVVWGKEVLRLRDDYVLLEHEFFDQSMQPLKRMSALDIGTLGGRTFATRMRMVDLGKPGQYTELEYAAAEFDLPLDDALFTQFALRDPGQAAR